MDTKKEQDSSGMDDISLSSTSLGCYTIQGLKQLYEARQLCDATLVAEGRIFSCHRALLASFSPYFRAMFTRPFRECWERQVVFEDMASSVLQRILDYLYTGELLLTPETAQDLFTAANRLVIRPLQEIIGRFLADSISMDSCLGIYALAYAHNHQPLLRVATRHITINFEPLSQHEAFPGLDPSTVISIVSSDKLLVSSELIVYHAVQRWVRSQPAEHLSLIKKLLKQVRLPLLTSEEITVVQKDIIEEYGHAHLQWEQLDGEGRLQKSGGLRHGMYDDWIVSLGLFVSNMQGGVVERLKTHFLGFSLQTESWEEIPPLMYLDSSGFLSVGHKLYVSGGQRLNGSVLGNLHEFDALTGQWMQLPSMSTPRREHGFLACKQKLYALGGRSGRSVLDSAESFDLVQKSWSPIANLPFAVSHFASATLKNKLYLIGGFSHTRASGLAHRGILIYETGSDVWNQVPLAFQCYKSTAVTMDNGIFVIGGLVEESSRRETPGTVIRALISGTHKCFFLSKDGTVSYDVAIPELPILVLPPCAVQWQRRIHVLVGNTIYQWKPGEPSWTRSRKSAPNTRVTFLTVVNGVTLRVPKKNLQPLLREASAALTAVWLADN
ncbi:kelch-like protein 6 [Lacerta agilis]|uniref:kelch-like protein 6 n=1 Tax=Lacerta agilis TaxID=80427 RepID=UPI00141A01C7|nr:kelch-like protein 6 [Lacerta agilis]XP_032996558.1 kelch-like protein 6 [Lacerta agilis]XP_032996559.1 kelch-like protein 6 [Lacerta agilis]